MARVVAALVGGLTLLAAVTGCDRPTSASIHYLGHAGWLVRTADHTLIFDYTGPVDADGDLARGAVAPTLLADERVIVFVSHAHGDHYKRRVLELRDHVADLTVVTGWNAPDAGAVRVPADGQWTDVAGAAVLALHHDFDGIPEGFFLVRSGGLTIYHSGDHGTWSDPPSAPFRANVDRLAAAAEGRIDVAFISAFGSFDGKQIVNAGDVYGITTLAPRVTFPMHRGGREEDYAAFAERVVELGLPTVVGVADRPGAHFEYANGALRPAHR